jgi:hypothetical protein
MLYRNPEILSALQQTLEGSTIVKVIPSKKDQTLFTLEVRDSENKVTVIDLLASDLGWWFVKKVKNEQGILYLSLGEMLKEAFNHSCYKPGLENRLILNDDPCNFTRGYRCSNCGEEFIVSCTVIRNSQHPYRNYMTTPEMTQEIADFYLTQSIYETQLIPDDLGIPPIHSGL